MTAVTWLGHSTVLIETGGARLLTDPVLRPRVAHLTRRAAAVDVGELGPLDAVLLSHVHRDHLDVPTLRTVPAGVPVVAPVGAAALIGGGRTVHELEPGEQLELGGASIAATPAVHEVRRRFRAVQALGFVAGGVYFAGDTDVFAGMSALGPVDTALLPVWGWGTSLGAGHMDPPAAAEAAALIGPRTAVPIHWGTYFPAHLGRSGHPLLRDPPHDFAHHVGKRSPGIRVVVPAVGERVEL
ncbi:MAG TPA: MBL fold metallo-hydrolase [Thermoleophilaceae bacterium]|nr:MBL fold metallo-hydrolase [Thermoleophilaceae bacterium]